MTNYNNDRHTQAAGLPCTATLAALLEHDGHASSFSATALLQQLQQAPPTPQPIPCTFLTAEPVARSAFYGILGAGGRAVLRPPAGRGCAFACVGDVVEVPIALTNRLSTALHGTLTLALGVMLQAASWEECHEATASQDVSIPPMTRSIFSFRLALTRTGLYVAKHVTLGLGHQRLHVACAGADAVHLLGTVDANGRLHALRVAIEVLPAAPRLHVRPRLPLGGALLAGSSQWVGFEVSPAHDVLDEAVLRASVPGADADALVGDTHLPLGSITLSQEDSTCWLWVAADPLPPATEAVRMGAGPAPARSAVAGGTIQADVAVEYTAGCRRSHACTLSLPVVQPWGVRCAAREAGGHVVLTAVLQPVADVLVEDVRMVPQPGYRLERLLYGSARVAVRQGAQLHVVALLSPEHGGGDDDTAVLEVDWRWQGTMFSREPPLATFVHHVQLERVADDMPGTQGVSVHFLGPFDAEVGHEVALLWQLEQQGGEGVLAYDVHADGDQWQPCGRRTGSVALGAEGATLELAYMPVRDGVLLPPELRVRNALHRDVAAVGIRVRGEG